MDGDPWTGVKKVLIANRGECALRILRSCKRLGVDACAVYTKEDAAALHVKQVEAHEVSSYCSHDEVLRVAAEVGADAVHPGYGFLAEVPECARAVKASGLAWLGPSAETIDKFAIKHVAKRLAREAGVPTTPESPLLESVEAASAWAEKIGYPVVLKPSAGGGGQGMVVVDGPEDMAAGFQRSKSVAAKVFQDDSVFLERFVRHGRHIEVQIFGDGQGNVVHLGERECSIQRRLQKVVEETPSPALDDATRGAIFAHAVKLAELINYESAGTVEFIYDQTDKKFYFLEVNTRLQVEHGVTEMVTGVDIVEWMIRQGHPSTMKALGGYVWTTYGSAIQVRIYAEDVVNDYRPSPGVVGDFQLPPCDSATRFETSAFRGFEVSAKYDPLIMKIIQWGPTRSECVNRLSRTLENTIIGGMPTNLELLRQIIASSAFVCGETTCSFLDTFEYSVSCFEVLRKGMSVAVQDYPGRTGRGLWRIGIPPSGAYDSLNARLANSLVGNGDHLAVLEVAIEGPTLKFHTDTVVAVTGPPFELAVNDIPSPMYTCLPVRRGDVLHVGGLLEKRGCRCYIAVRGGVDVPLYLGSRSTFTKGGFGGYQGRELSVGDVLPIGTQPPTIAPPGGHGVVRALPKSRWPEYRTAWEIGVLPGPQANPDFMTDRDIEMIHDTEWEVHHNSNRLGIRLIGNAPEWARSDGGEGGAHPSNIHDNEYAIGAVTFSGDMPIIISHDGPSLGGFMAPITIVQSELWKLGQLSAGNTVKFKLLDLETALRAWAEQNVFIKTLDAMTSIASPLPFNNVYGLEAKAVMLEKAPTEGHPGMCVRLAGDRYVLVEYGPMLLDIRYRIRVHFLEKWFLQEAPIGMEETAPGVRSLQIRYDPLILNLRDLLGLIDVADEQIPDLNTIVLPTRVFHLPLAWDHSCVDQALEKYTKSVRSEAPYLPSNIEFIARNNGLASSEDARARVFRASYMCLGLGDVYLGACCAVPTDPRDRLVNPKFNPSRTWTLEGTVGLGGAYMCIYPMSSPGGYQLVGRTLPIWNTWGLDQPSLFSPQRPWLLDMFDQIRYYPVTESELERLRREFQVGRFVPTVVTEDFDVKEYSQMLDSIKEETKAYVDQQSAAAALMNEEEHKSLENLARHGNRLGEPPMVTDVHEGMVPVASTITANVWEVCVSVGDEVKKGDTVVMLEAMKMELPVRSPQAGIVKVVNAQVGVMAPAGFPLVLIHSLSE